MEVPRADRMVKPIFLNEKPFAETYRRNGDGDYHCSEQMIRGMFRDSCYETQDMKILENMSIDVFDMETVKRYRNNLRTTRPKHIWNNLENIEFLHKIKAVAKCEAGKLYPTAAGLLMFGYDYEIVNEYPYYFLDYQDQYDITMRWTDRITSSTGEWSGNLYDFFFKAINKLVQNTNIKTPFKMRDNIHRDDDTHVHKALREALANCLFNADFYSECSLIIKNLNDKITIQNPGRFRIGIEEALEGGVSSPRNATIMTMFMLIDIGEKAGSGIPSIFKAWEEQGWGIPEFTELSEPERTVLTMRIKKDYTVEEMVDCAVEENDDDRDVKSINAFMNANTERFEEDDITVEKTVDTTVEEDVAMEEISENTVEKIYEVIKNNPQVTQKELEIVTGLTRRGVEWNLSKLKSLGLIKRIGPNKGGFWKISQNKERLSKKSDKG